MAMFAPIPMPQGHNEVFKDVMDYYEQLQKRKAQQDQFSQELATNKDQFAQKLALSKQAEDRAQALMPYMIQQYKDLHGKEAAQADIQKIYRDLIKDALENGGGASAVPGAPGGAPGLPKGGEDPSLVAYPGTSDNPLLSEQNRQRLQQFMAQNPNLPDEQKAQISNFLQMPQSPMTAGGAPLSPGMVPGAAPAPALPGQTPISGQPGQAPQMPGQMPGQVPGQLPGQPQEQKLPQAMPAGGEGGIPPGQEVTVKPGNPQLEKLDRVAGLVPGIPKPQTHFAPNGMIVTRYPSGKVTLQNTGIPGMKTVNQETPQERQQRETQTKIDVATGTDNAKTASKLVSSGRELISLVDRAKKVKDLLDENPGLTGWLQGGLASLNLSQSKKLAEFDQTTRKLQADMGRYGSQRGGAQVLKWAERSKPGTYKSVDYNQGMVKSILDDAKADYVEMAREYKDRTGKDFPVPFPEMGSNAESGGGSDRITIVDSNGGEHTILRQNLDKARERDKGLRVKGGA